MITVSRYHDISAGHRVCGHESKCSHLHGHNYRITFECTADELDHLGRVIDFSLIKEKLCQWLEDHWDHHFLVWEEDPIREALQAIDPTVVVTPFNPTAENMARYLSEVVAPKQLEGTGVSVIRCSVEETRKCTATWSLTQHVVR